MKAHDVRRELGAPCWLLYHGTSTYRLKRILQDKSLRTAPLGDQWLSLTTDRLVAEHFAHMAVFGDRHDHPNEESYPVVLVLSGDDLMEYGYPLEHIWDLS